MAIGIIVIDKVAAPRGAGAELLWLNGLATGHRAGERWEPGSTYRVGGVNASVDDVGAGAGTGVGIVGVGGASGGSRGDTGKTPGGASLGLLDGDNGVLLNVVDRGVVLESLELGGGQAGSEAAEALGVGVVGLGLDGVDGRVDGGADGVLGELDNVLALKDLGVAGSQDGSGRVALDGRGGGQRHGDESEKSGSTHDGGVV